VVLVAATRNVVDGDPLLVLDTAEGLRGLVGHPVEIPAAVAGHPGPAEVVAVDDADRPVGMQVVDPPRVERQRDLVGTALGVEVDIRIGVVHPARRHRLGAGRDALIPLDDVVPRRRAGLDRVRAEVEVVEGAVLLEEDLGGAD
jgi:hypothetical protein